LSCLADKSDNLFLPELLNLMVFGAYFFPFFDNFRTGDTAAEGGKAFFLPLHQRLQLIRSRDAAKKKRQAKEKAALKASSGAAAAAAAAASSEKEEEEETPAEKAAAEKASRRAALQSLTSEGGWFGSDWKKAPASAGGGADEGAAEDATDGYINVTTRLIKGELSTIWKCVV